MSDSEDAPSVPSDSRIDRALRDVVAALFKAGDLENLTVKRVRKSVEQQLALPADYFKSHDVWADKSKRVITEESEAQQDVADGDGDAAPSSPPPKPTPKKKKSAPKPKPAPAPKKAAKRQQGKPNSIVLHSISHVSWMEPLQCLV